MLRIIGAIVVVIIAFGATLLAMTWWSGTGEGKKPVLVETKPLPPASRTSVAVVPVAVAISAIRDSIDRAAPPSLAGKGENPLGELMSKLDIGWTVTRGPFTAAGRPDGLTIATPLNGSLRVTGQIAGAGGNIAGALGGLLGQDLGKQAEGLIGRVLDQRADIRGSVTVRARPTLWPEWRIDPNLTGQVALADAGLSIAGIRLNIPGQVKPLLDQVVNEQINTLQARVRTDPFIEQAARRDWAKMCRSISLKGIGADTPDLWLEIRPTKAIAAQPVIDAKDMTLLLGVEAQTRIVPTATKPDCPFPATLELVPQMERPRVAIGLPIDVPFTEVNKIVEAQLKGRKFPEDGSGSTEVTVLRASLAASGERILISLRVNAREKKFLGLGAEATVHIWGKPALDRAKQTLRLTEIELDVESEAAFGLLGAAARAAIPYVQDAIADSAQVDLKPFMASAKQSIETALRDFEFSGRGVRVDSAVNEVRLAGIEFDSKTLRVIAEADGSVKAAVTALP